MNYYDLNTFLDFFYFQNFAKNMVFNKEKTDIDEAYD